MDYYTRKKGAQELVKRMVFVQKISSVPEICLNVFETWQLGSGFVKTYLKLLQSNNHLKIKGDKVEVYG